MTTENWIADLTKVAQPEKIKILSSFFKTGKGEYGEGDVFIGINVPDNRAVARRYAEAPISAFQEMLNKEIHEFRLSALLAMVHSYQRTKDAQRRADVINLYLQSTSRCNNWDLVDLSAPYLFGSELAIGKRETMENLEKLSASPLLWDRRISVVSTLHLIQKKRQTELAEQQCLKHLADPEPLMHKAVGWILREIGKKDKHQLLDILYTHAHEMTATTLSYATEKLDKDTRQQLRAIRNKKN